MNYKPDEKDWMAYLYGELEDKDKVKMDHYLLHHEEGRKELEKWQKLRAMMSALPDKEVIAPPVFVDGGKRHYFWNSPYFNTIISIAASLLLILLAGKLTGTRISFSGNEFKMSFGEVKEKQEKTVAQKPVLTPLEVQQMISTALNENNAVIQADWKQSQQKLNASIRKNLDRNSEKLDHLVREAATASREQVHQYVAGIQAQNMKMVKDYFTLTSAEQKKYIENLLVDFSGYLQQQRANDMQLVQTQLNSLKQNNDIFKQETEQILTSIITTVGNQPPSAEIKN